MPAQADPEIGAPITVALAPLIEIESAICGIVGRHKHSWGGLSEAVNERHPALAEQFRGFWDDGQTEWLELFVLLEHAGLTLESDVDEVLRRLPEIAAEGVQVPDLPSEGPTVRATTQARLDRLAEDPGLRAAWCAALAGLWAVARREWLEHGEAQAREMARDIRRRLDAGATVAEVLPERHLALNDAFRPLLDGDSPIVITPLGLGGSAKYILQAEGGPVYVGFGPGQARSDTHRKRHEDVAGAFKVLSDPTRLGLLDYLLDLPGSVSDLSRAFDVSQPTISAHVKVLREAGLLTSARRGTHTLYRASPAVVRDYLDRQAAALLGERTDMRQKVARKFVE